jgi:hypothetical protein
MGLAIGRSPSSARGSMAGRRDVAISLAGAIGAVVFGFRIDGRW